MTIKHFNSNQPPGIYVLEVLEPGDAQEDLQQFNAVNAKEFGGQAYRDVFGVLVEYNIPSNANIISD